MKLKQLKTELKEKEELLKIYEQRPEKKRLKIEIYNTYHIKCEVSALKKGIEACEEILHSQQIKKDNLRSKDYLETLEILRNDFEKSKQQLTEEKK